MNKPMTPATERAMAVIKPMADILRLKVSADDSLLYVDDVAIGIGCNSTWATVNEFIGYAFLREFADEFRRMEIGGRIESDITRYWYNNHQIDRMREEQKGETE